MGGRHMEEEWRLYHRIHDDLLSQREDLENKLSDAVKSLIALYQNKIAELEIENAHLLEQLENKE